MAPVFINAFAALVLLVTAEQAVGAESADKVTARPLPTPLLQSWTALSQPKADEKPPPVRMPISNLPLPQPAPPLSPPAQLASPAPETGHQLSANSKNRAPAKATALLGLSQAAPPPQTPTPTPTPAQTTPTAPEQARGAGAPAPIVSAPAKTSPPPTAQRRAAPQPPVPAAAQPATKPSQPAKFERSVRYAGTEVNIRLRPDINSRRIDIIDEGKTLDVVSPLIDGKWVKVARHGEVLGYAAARFPSASLHGPLCSTSTTCRPDIRAAGSELCRCPNSSRPAPVAPGSRCPAAATLARPASRPPDTRCRAFDGRTSRCSSTRLR